MREPMKNMLKLEVLVIKGISGLSGGPGGQQDTGSE